MPTRLFTHACGCFRAGSAPTKAPLLPQDAANVSQVQEKGSFQSTQPTPPAPNRSTTRIKPPAVPSIISSIPPLTDRLGNQKLHFRSKWPVLARPKSKGELSVFVPYPPVPYAGSTRLSTHLAAPHHYDARHFKNAYPVTRNRIISSRHHNEPMTTPQTPAWTRKKTCL